MKDYIKSLMFVGIVMVMGSANAVEPVATDSTASATSLTAEQQQLLEDIVDQTGLRDGKLDDRAVTKENVIDAVRRTVESHKKNKELLKRIMSDLQQIMPDIAPRGILYKYGDKQNIDYDKLETVKLQDVAMVKEGEVKVYTETDNICNAIICVTEVISKYLQAKSTVEQRRAEIELGGIFKNNKGSIFIDLRNSLMKLGGIKQAPGDGITISAEKFKDASGNYISIDALFNKIVDLVAENSLSVDAAKKAEILMLKKQSKANWYNREIRPALQKIKREKVIETE